MPNHSPAHCPTCSLSISGSQREAPVCWSCVKYQGQRPEGWEAKFDSYKRRPVGDA